MKIDVIKIHRKLASLSGKKAKKFIYGEIKKANKGASAIGSRRYTTQFLTDSSRGVSQIEVFEGEGGKKLYVFEFKDGIGVN